jgi:molybdopterin converting factor small subunit
VSVVRLPPVLRQSAGGQRELRISGSTVGEVLEGLYAEHPGMRSQLLGDDGELHRFVNLYVNEEDVKLLDWLDTPVEDDDTLLILPAMAGGAAGARRAEP